MLADDGGPMNQEGVRARRTALVEAGFNFFPERTGKKNSSQTVGTWRGKCGTFDPSQDYSDNFGTLFNDALYTDGLYAFDIDVDDPHWAHEIVSTLCHLLGSPGCVRWRENSPRSLLLYRRLDPVAGYVGATGSDGAVEVFTGDDMKVGAFGIHRHKVTRAETRMHWLGVPGNVRKADLPAIDAVQRDDALHAILEMLGDEAHTVTRSSHTTTASQKADCLDDLVAAAAAIPNTGIVDWHEWNRLGMALYGATEGSDRGLLAFHDWSQKNLHTRRRDCVERWNNFQQSPPTRIGACTIFKLAAQHGYVRTGRAAAIAALQWQQDQCASRRIQNWQPKI